MSSITAILTAFRRPGNIEPLVDAIRRQSVPSTSVWCWANDPDERMKTVLAEAKLDRVVNCSDNARFHGRFALALLARTEFVAIFDDDSIPGEQWFENCLKTMAETPGILGTAGVVLEAPQKVPGTLCRNGPEGAAHKGFLAPFAADYARRTMHGWQRPSDKTIEVDLVCQAWFLRTEWVKHLFSSMPVIGTNGEDIELAARAWRQAGIRSFCPPHPPGDTRKWGSTRGMELGLDEVAASFRVEHLTERRQVVEAEIAAGWKPMCMRKTSVVGSPLSVAGEKAGARSQESEEGDRLQGTEDSSVGNALRGVPPESAHGEVPARRDSPPAGHAEPELPPEAIAPLTSRAALAQTSHRETEQGQNCAHGTPDCRPQWVTSYSYPLDCGPSARAVTTLRFDGALDESSCLDRLDTIESLGEREAPSPQPWAVEFPRVWASWACWRFEKLLR